MNADRLKFLKLLCEHEHNKMDESRADSGV